MAIKRILFIFFVFLSIKTYAQPSNLVFYTNNTMLKFRLYVNGRLVNNTFEQNVRLEDINANNYQIKIVFQNMALGYIAKSIYVRPNTEKIYSFKKQKPPTGRRRTIYNPNTSPFVLDLVSETPRYSVDDEFLGSVNDQDDVVAYTTTACPEMTDFRNVQNQTSDIIIGNEKNNITIGANGIKVNLDVSNFINKINAAIESDNNYLIENQYNDNTSLLAEEQLNSLESEMIIQNNTCSPNFSEKQFQFVISQLKQENFESKKLTFAKVIAETNCLLTKQVRDIIKLFNFENNRLEFAKFAYKNVADKENYILLLDSFNFKTSKQELKEYIGI